MKSRPFEQLFSVGTGFCMGFLKSSKTDHNPFLFKNCKYKAKAAQIKRFKRLMLELLGRFELPTSSLPTTVEPSSPCCIRLCGVFFVQKGCGRSLFVPLFPSAHFPVWVTVWVKQLSGRERGAHLRQRQTKPLRPVPLIGDAGHFFNKAFLLRCGACPTHTVFAAQLKEYLIKTFFLCIFAAIPRRIRRRSDFIHIHAKHLLAENQSR